MKQRIEIGAGPEMRIGESASHEWIWQVPGGRYVEMEILQKGIDVEIRLYQPGKSDPHRIVDGLSGEWGVERLSVAPRVDTDYRLVVAPSTRSPKTGCYQITTSVPRVPREEDLRNIHGEQEFDDAERLRRAGGYDHLQESYMGYRKAHTVFVETEAHEGQFVALRMIGWAAERLELEAEARTAYRELQELSLRLDRRNQEASALNLLGRLDFTAGRDHDAEERFREALKIAEELNDPRLSASCLNNLASLFYRREHLVEALEQFMAVLQIRIDLDQPRQQAMTLFNISRVLQAQGKFPEAVDCLEQALDLREQIGDDTRTIETIIQLGSLYRRIGRPRKAKNLYQQLVSRGTEKLLPRWRIILSNSLGLVDADLGDDQTAAEHFADALNESRRLKLTQFEAMSVLNLSGARQRAGADDEALELVGRARDLFQELKDRRHLAACDLVEGLTHRAQGRLEAALKCLESASTLIEDLRLDHSGWSFRMSFYATRQTYFDELIDLLIQLHEVCGGSEFLEQALQINERRRARSLLDAITEGRLNIQGDPAVIAQEQRLIAALAETGSEIERASPKRHAELDEKRRDLLVRLESVRSSIRRSNPQYAALNRLQPLSTDKIRKVLDHQTRLLVYSLGQRRSFLLVLDRKSAVQAFELPKREVIEKVIKMVQAPLKAQQTDRLQKGRRKLEQLADMLLGPLGKLDDRRLAIVADGILHSLPFAALPEPIFKNESSSLSSEIERPWLIEKREIVYLPSASALAALRQESKDRVQPYYDIAVFADPVLSRNDQRFHRRKHLDNRSDRPVPNRLREALRDIGLRADLERLPATGVEAQAITELFPEHLRTTAVSFDASRRMFEEIDLAQFRILHFAVHGILNAAQPELSGLVLSLFDETGRPVDGFIRAHELYSRRLAADLVVLSACKTGLGRQVRGEGLIGLQRSFLDAGASRVVASLWSVADGGTATLMTAFYREIHEGDSPSTALRKAQLAMIRSEDPQDRLPFYWAAFVLLGDWYNAGRHDGGIGESDDGEIQLEGLDKDTAFDTLVDHAGPPGSPSHGNTSV